MFKHQLANQAPETHSGHLPRKPNEDWEKIPDIKERRRIQNRIAQRKYRKKRKLRLEEPESCAGINGEVKANPLSSDNYHALSGYVGHEGYEYHGAIPTYSFPGATVKCDTYSGDGGIKDKFMPSIALMSQEEPSVCLAGSRYVQWLPLPLSPILRN